MSQNVNLKREFDRQIENLVRKKYPKAAGLSDDEFLEHIEPLRKQVGDLSVSLEDLDKGHLPFVIVIKSDLVETEKAMNLVERQGKEGVIKLFPLEPNDFNSIDDVVIPDGLAYLIVDIDRGKDSINIAPKDAMIKIQAANRSPLTIDEGVAIITHYPDFLMRNNCFSLLASRHSGDKRVPAIWINAKKQANLGWCWNGNPHTWLGSASCGSRTIAELQHTVARQM